MSVAISEFVKLVAEGKFAEAARKIKETNCLPAVCGRVCPQETQCEQRCILGKKGDPLAVGRLERFAADFERNNNAIEIPRKAPPTGKRVAVVGSGPAGLTAAGDLILLGHEVTVFEAFHKPGGVLMYGIPEFRLPKEIVEKEVDYLRRLGVRIEFNQVIGKSITVDELLDEEGFDAVFVGVGAGLPSFMNIPGENLGGVYSANEYLTRSNLMKAYAFPDYDTPVVRGRNVCVVGGGNVAMDSARTARRLGGENVYVLYRRSREEMPARAEEIHHAEQEGIVFKLLCAPIEYLGDERGMVRQVRCQEMELGEPDDSGRRAPGAQARGRVHPRHRPGDRGHRLRGESPLDQADRRARAESPRLHRGQRIGPHDPRGRLGRRRHRHRQRHRDPRHGSRQGRRPRHPRVSRQQRAGRPSRPGPAPRSRRPVGSSRPGAPLTRHLGASQQRFPIAPLHLGGGDIIISGSRNCDHPPGSPYTPTATRGAHA